MAHASAPEAATSSSAVCGARWQVLIYSAEGELLQTYQAYENALGIKCVGWHPRGELLAIGSYDERLRVLNSLTWTRVAECTHPSARSTCYSRQLRGPFSCALSRAHFFSALPRNLLLSPSRTPYRAASYPDVASRPLYPSPSSFPGPSLHTHLTVCPRPIAFSLGAAELRAAFSEEAIVWREAGAEGGTGYAASRLPLVVPSSEVRLRGCLPHTPSLLANHASVHILDRALSRHVSATGQP